VVLEESLTLSIHLATMTGQGAGQEKPVILVDREGLDALQRLNPLDEEGVQPLDDVGKHATGLDPVRHVHQKGVRHLEGVLRMLDQRFRKVQGFRADPGDLLLPLAPVAPALQAEDDEAYHDDEGLEPSCRRPRPDVSKCRHDPQP
jgi:hypothetical protein